MNNIIFTAKKENKAPALLNSNAMPFLTANFETDVTRVQVDAKTPIYYLASQAGFDQTLPGQITKQGLEISKAYVDDDGNEVTRFEQGKELTVRLRIRTLGSGTVRNVAVIDLLPGGFEVIRSSVPRTAYNWRADYVDVREDRVVFYGDFTTSVKELSYRVKLTAAGSFTIPPAFVEAMYDRSKHANTLAGSFEVMSAK